MASTDTIVSRLIERARLQPNAAAYHERRGGVWHTSSWAEYRDQVLRAARALCALGFEPGQTVCILGFNRPEWVLFDLAAMAAGGAPAGIYTTCSPEEVRYIVAHAASPVVLVENEAQWEKIKAERSNMPDLRHVVVMRGAPAIDDELVMSWDEFMAKGDEVGEAVARERIDACEPDGLATLIYTSGTTGPPKGVMLSHRNLTWTADIALDLTRVREGDCSISYLPLSHIAEQMFSIHLPITTGYSVYFAESMDALPENLKEVQPSVFFAVPRVWEKFRDGISAKLAQATGVKKALAEWAMGVGSQVAKVRSRGGEPTGLLAVQYALASRLIFQKVKSAIGLGRSQFLASGAAPISREVLELMASLDMIVYEIYGQSEDTGPTSANRPGNFAFGTVGPVLPGVEVRFGDDGEILVKGPNVFLGYYKEPKATDETLVDGWLHSGDLGRLDNEGFLHITGRKKDIIITAGGKNITPKNIEAALKEHELINEAVVVGDRRKFLSALVTVDPEATKSWAATRGVAADGVHESPELEKEIQGAVERMNQRFARVEQIKKFRILPRNLSIEDGELTPTLKVKRNVVYEHFADEIESMYAE